MQNYTQVTSRIWHIVCYDEKVRDEICSKATRYAYIYHDRDTLKDGSPKPPHYHIYVYRRNDTKGDFFVKLGKKVSPENGGVRVAVQNDGAQAVEYFQHLKDGNPIEGKAPYSLNEIVFDSKGNDDHFKSQEQRLAERAEREQKAEDDNVAFINDLIIHRHNPYALAKKYGKGYICNRQRFTEFTDLLIDDYNLPLEDLNEEAINALCQLRDQTTIQLPPPNVEYGMILLGYQSAQETMKHAVLNNMPPEVRVSAYKNLQMSRIETEAFEDDLLGKHHRFNGIELDNYRQACIQAFYDNCTPRDDLNNINN